MLVSAIWNPRKAELQVSVGEESVEEVGVEVDPLCVVNLCEPFNQNQIVSSVVTTLWVLAINKITWSLKTKHLHCSVHEYLEIYLIAILLIQGCKISGFS